MAEVILRHQASALGLAERLAVDSAGTAADVGFDIDRRARRALERRGYTPLGHRGRQFEPAWLSERDLVIGLQGAERIAQDGRRAVRIPDDQDPGRQRSRLRPTGPSDAGQAGG